MFKKKEPGYRALMPRVIKVIESCTTIEHLIAAYKHMDFAMKKDAPGKINIFNLNKRIDWFDVFSLELQAMNKKILEIGGEINKCSQK